MKTTILLCGSLLVLLCACENDPGHGRTEAVEEYSLFERLSSDSTSILFMNTVEENEVNNYFTNQYVFNGGGVAAGDVNNDGLPDLYFAGNDVEDKLYLNRGNMHFEDVTLSAGIDKAPGTWSTGVTMVDINADGWLDIYVCKSGHARSPEATQNLLYLNRGDGSFVELGAELGLNDAGFSVQAAFFDYDRDGDLDLYVMNYPGEWNSKGILLAKQGLAVPPRFTDNLYRNEGNAKFSRIGFSAGINNYAFGLGLATTDVNGDGWLDIYVGNDYQENDYLYINNKDGTFSEEVKRFTNHNSQSSMGLDFGDINNDGLKDFFVAEMLPEDYRRSKVNMASMNPEAFWNFIDEGIHYQYMRNVLQLNSGANFFSDVAQICGVQKTDWSWSPFFADLDNDGDLDLYISNGIRRDMMYKDATKERENLNKQGKSWNYEQAYNMIPSTKLSNYVYRNDGDLHFTNCSEEWGLDELSFSNGAIYCDLDRDGDLDLVVNNLDDKAWICENNGTDNNWLAVSLSHVGRGNRFGLNASVEVWRKGRGIFREIRPTKGFQSAVEAIAHFGLGKDDSIDSLRVIWANGNIQTVLNPGANQYFTVNYEDNAAIKPLEDSKMFTEVSNQIGLVYSHQESEYDDFSREVLLPHRQSTLGPFIAVGDVNGDSWDDFYIGGAAGQAGQLFVQDGGVFKTIDVPNFHQDRYFEDMGACFFDANGDGRNDLYVVSGGNEFDNQHIYRDRLYINMGDNSFSRAKLGRISSSGSCVVSGDIDGDGDTDLFIGGRATPGRYPFADESFFLINEGGDFIKRREVICPEIGSLGIVTDAELVDFTGDGQLDLVVVGEWMKPVFFKGRSGKFEKVKMLDEAATGWWNCIEAVDLDGDGDMDFVAGNMGENHKFRPSGDKPFHIYAHDFDENGILDIVLAKPLEDNTLVPVRGKQCMSEQMPFISADKFDSYEDFAAGDMESIFGESLLRSASIHHEADNFSSCYIINDGKGSFYLEALPYLAQISAVNGVVILDVDGDGIEEVLVAGNMYGTEVETSRADASVGCLIKAGQSITNSGFFAPGNVKDLKCVKTPRGLLVLVANNNGPLQAFQLK